MTFFKGTVEGKLSNVKQQEIDADKAYIVTDLPENSITNEMMAAILEDNRLAAWFNINNTYVCIDEGTYHKGHIYQYKGNSWEDITVSGSNGSGIETLIGTQEKPINFATDMEAGHLYSISGYYTYDGVSSARIDYWSCVCSKLKDNIIMFYNALMPNTESKLITAAGVGGNLMLRINPSSGAVEYVYQTGSIERLNGNDVTSGRNIIYAPTSGGTSGQILQSNGENQAPTWIDIPSANGNEKLVGTQENPINFYSDTEVGKLYSISGYFRYNTEIVGQIEYNVLAFRAAGSKIVLIGAYATATTTSALIMTRAGSNSILSVIEDSVYGIETTVAPKAINGSATGNSGIYAPTYVGTTGQVLTVSEYGGLTWQTLDFKPTKETYSVSSWTETSDISPYTHSAKVTATYTINDDTEVELFNNNPVAFANHGFAIAEVNGQEITIYSVGQPAGEITLTIGYRG